MSFLDQKYSATVAARLTQKGRNAISHGNFNISYFAVGDSEFNYTGSLTQKVLTPFDRDYDIKYPLWYTTGTTVYGIPAVGSMIATCNDVLSADSTGWTSNVVWEKNPIGYTGSTLLAYTGFTNASYLGTKSYFGYSSTSGQTYYVTTGSTTGTTTGTTITNSVGSTVVITPEEQKAIAIFHYTQNGTDEKIYFKYDDYISTTSDITIDNTNNPSNKTNQQYFQVTIPSLMYHRSATATTGATFYMSTGNTKMMGSNYNSNYTINYKDLVDYTGNTVGKIFYNQQTIVFDDEEIVAALDTGSTRNFTLAAPFVNGLVTNNDYITGLTSGQTIWVTYMLSGDTVSNTLPCNYYMKVTGSTNHEAVTVQFGGSSFNFLNSGYTASKFYILAQITNGSDPLPLGWRMMDFTSILGSITNLKTGFTFTIHQADITNSTWYSSTLHDFGNGGRNVNTVQVVRSSDIEEMCFNLSLPINTFNSSQNPTYKTGYPTMTEVSLLDDNKNTLVMGKLATPIQRIGSQVIQVKLDF
jgi:hypothetical protein